MTSDRVSAFILARIVTTQASCGHDTLTFRGNLAEAASQPCFECRQPCRRDLYTITAKE